MGHEVDMFWVISLSLASVTGIYTTVGGYVLGRLGRRARVGDTIEVGERRMRVVTLDGLRVAKVWLSTPAMDQETGETPTPPPSA